MRDPKKQKRRSGLRLFILCTILAVLTAVYWPLRQQRLDKDLIEAVLSNDLPSTHKLLDSGADPNSRIGKRIGTTQNRNFLEWLKSLFLRRPPDPSDNAKTALMLAAGSDKLAIVRDLLAHHAEPNLRLSDGTTALM